MLDLINSFHNSNMKDVLDVLAIILPSFATYFITSKNISAPKRREIKQNQFDLVYLPLYLLMKQYDITNNINNFPIFIRKVEKVIYKNYQYVYPKTIKLFGDFKNGIWTEVPNRLFISSFLSQIETDYEKLKRELGYPTNSFLSSFKHQNKIDRLFNILMLVMIVYLGCLASIIYLDIIKGKWFEALFLTPFFCISVLFFYSIWYSKNN